MTGPEQVLPLPACVPHLRQPHRVRERRLLEAWQNADGPHRRER